MIIPGKKDTILVVKEKGSAWSLPGGGIDHGEIIETALKRELYEEARITSPFTAQLMGVDSFYVEPKERWQLWLVYTVTIPHGFSYGVGVDADEVAFIDPNTFKDSPRRSEQLVYRWCVEKARP